MRDRLHTIPVVDIVGSAQVREDTMVETLRQIGYEIFSPPHATSTNEPRAGESPFARPQTLGGERTVPRYDEKAVAPPPMQGDPPDLMRVVTELRWRGFTVARAAEPIDVELTIRNTVVDPTVRLERVRLDSGPYSAAKIGANFTHRILKSLAAAGFKIVKESP